MNANSFEVGADDFASAVLERSHDVPVLVDFWAPWCGPCRSLKPVLEKLAMEFDGKFALAKLNTDEHPTIAAEFGIRSIPNVKAFRNGRMVDEFLGALPELQVRKFIERLVPSAAEELRRAAQASVAAGSPTSALEQLDAAIALEPKNDLLLLDKAAVLIGLGRAQEAKQTLELVSPLAQSEDSYLRLAAQLDVMSRVEEVGDAEELRARVDRDPADLEARIALADWHTYRKEYAASLPLLLEAVKRDRKYGDDAARKKMLQVFSLLENRGDLVDQYRRLLARALN